MLVDTAKHCRTQSIEYLNLIQSARNQTETRLLNSPSQSWIRLANQIDRLSILSTRNNRANGQLSAPLHDPLRARKCASRKTGSARR